MESLLKVFSSCMPSFLIRDNLPSSYNNEIQKEKYQTYKSKTENYDENYDFPVIQVFGHGWDPTLNDDDLIYPSAVKVSSSNLDVAEVYGLEHRGPYIEFKDDVVEDNVVHWLHCRVPNLLISTKDFTGSIAFKLFRFGFFVNGQDATTQFYQNGVCDILTVKDIIRFLNQIYPDGYYLELHVSRIDLSEFNIAKLPLNASLSADANELIYEHRRRCSQFNYNEWREPKWLYDFENYCDHDYELATYHPNESEC